ncbi:MAG: ParB/RepB/Spo0J family partition protein [Verrucomicrobiota bacterium]
MDNEIETILLEPSEISGSPLNPRKFFREEGIEELAESIKQRGVLQAVGVRRVDGGSYELIWGERRWRAASTIEGAKVPARVENLSDEEVFELMVLENLHRDDLTITEEARAYEKMVAEFGYSQTEIAEICSVRQQRISDRLMVLEFDEDVQKGLDKRVNEDGHIPLYAALIAAQVKDPMKKAEALEVAREAPNRGAAAQRVREGFLRPLQEKEEWGTMDWRGDYDEHANVVQATYEESRRFYPFSVDILTPITANGWVLADDVPDTNLLGEGAHDPSVTWGGYAETYEVEIKAVVDGTMAVRHLVHAETVVQADRLFHTFVLSFKKGRLWIEGGYELTEVSRFNFWASEAALSGPDSSYQGNYLPTIDEPAGLHLGEDEFRVFPSEEEAGGAGVLPMGPLKSEDGRPIVFVEREHEWPFYGVNLDGCAFRHDRSSGVEEFRADEEGGDEEGEDFHAAREAMKAEMIGDLVEAIRLGGSFSQERLMIESSALLCELGIAGFDGNEHPLVRLLHLLEIEDTNSGLVMSDWEGFSDSRAGYESAVVGAWCLYWLDEHEGELEECIAWKKAMAIYGGAA